MKKQSKIICLFGMLCLLAMMFLTWKLPQKTSFLQETSHLSSEMADESCMWLKPQSAAVADALFQRTSRTLVFGQFRIVEKTIKTESVSRYQIACMLAVWCIGFLLPQITIRGLRKRLVTYPAALWQNIDYIHHLDGKKKSSVATLKGMK